MSEVKELKLLNIYQKLQKSRVELQKTSMKKSGKNTYSNYSYFELGDFLPQANEISANNGIASIFNYTEEIASLTIFDTDKVEDTILFTTPVKPSELKGCSPMQSIGAMQTYARRYLYVMAFEVSENDLVNIAEVDEDAELAKKKINSLKVTVIKEAIKKSNTNEKSFCNWALVEKVEDITNKNFNTCIAMLEKAVDKYEKEHKNDKKDALEGVI